MPTQKQQDEEKKERRKKTEQDNQARIKAQDDAKKAERQRAMEAASEKAAEKQKKSDAEKNKRQAMAMRMDQAIAMIVRRVKKLRKDHSDKTGLNAGDNGIPGGSANPLQWDSSILQLMNYRNFYTGSYSTGVKFAIPVKDQDNVLIHLKSV